MKATIQQVDRLIKLKEVSALTSLSKSQIYQLVKHSDFPRQRQLGGRCSAWKLSEVLNWINSLPVGSDGSNPVKIKAVA